MKAEVWHFLLEIVAGGLASSIFLWNWSLSHILKSVYGQRIRISEVLWLAVFGAAMATIHFTHALIGTSSWVAQPSFFIPATWLLGRLLFAPLLLLANRNTPQLFSSVLSHGLALFLFAVMVLLGFFRGTYYYGEGVIGRPLELVAAVLGIAVLVSLERCNGRYKWLSQSLIIFVAAQLTMSLSHTLFDTPFQLAHVGTVVALLLIVRYMHEVSRAAMGTVLQTLGYNNG